MPERQPKRRSQQAPPRVGNAPQQHASLEISQRSAGESGAPIRTNVNGAAQPSRADDLSESIGSRDGGAFSEVF